MADKKKKKTSSAGWPRRGQAYSNWAKGLKTLSAGEDELAKGMKGGLALASEVFAPGSLGRLDEGVPLNLAELGGDLNWQRNNAGNRSADAQYSLDAMKAIIEKAKTRSPEIQRLIDERTKGLSGLSNDESIAARELGQSGMNRGLQTALRGLRSRFGTARGPAATYGASPALAEFANSQAQLERQLIQDDYTARQNALTGYENTVRGVGRDEMTDLMDSTGAFSGYLQNLEDSEFGRAANARDAYANYAMGLDNRTNTLKMYNQGQNAAEKAGALGLVFGGGNLRTQTQAANRGYELGLKQLEMAQQPMMGFGGMGGGAPAQGGFTFNPVPQPGTTPATTTPTTTQGQTARTQTPMSKSRYGYSIFDFGT